jgi:hypothetical protein
MQLPSIHMVLYTFFPDIPEESLKPVLKDD